MPDSLHPADEPLRSTIQELEEFKNSRVWHDIKQFLEEREEAITRQLRSVDTVEEMRRRQGALENLDDMKQLPDKFIQELEALQDGQ